MSIKSRLSWLILLMSLIVFSQAHAAQRKVVLQISDGSAEKQTLVLNVASNLMKYYGQDNIQLEIVTFGPGLRLLFADNANRDRVQSLGVYGVKFAACENTMKAVTKQLGHAPRLVPQAVPVPAGVARIIELTDAGYTLIRP